MPLVRSRVATVGVGLAPWSSQCCARCSSSSMSEGSCCGLYWPIVSIVRPSRGERRSATTIRQIGFFFEPTLLSLIRTMRSVRLAALAPPGPQQPVHVAELAEVAQLVGVDDPIDALDAPLGYVERQHADHAALGVPREHSGLPVDLDALEAQVAPAGHL